MAELHHIATGRAVRLRPSHTVGRSPDSHLELPENWISGNHARFDWSGAGWEVRDLGSKNGTFVDGRRLTAGDPARLGEGCRVAFGKSDDPWIFLRAGEAGVGARRQPEGTLRWGAANTLSLPDEDHPDCTVFLDEDNRWVADQDGEQRAVRDGELLFVGDTRWELILPSSYRDTVDISVTPPTLSDLHLKFYVSSNEEHVELKVELHGQEYDLGARTHHYVLLTLARVRAAARDPGAPTAGWAYTDELAPRLRIETNTMNVNVHRIRQAFAKLPIEGGANIIERRTAARQLRISNVRTTVHLI
ncbi:MAG: FHA domain-containing protein [Deltaproteobacteria bacterium]|jgi:hypothetical protein|nr:FHA domain-containing protein [Deltaproteobacteria bacterium]